MSGYFTDKEPRELRSRLPVLYAVAALGIFVLVVRFWHLQVLENDYYTELSQNNRMRLVKTPAPRGLISDTNGRILVENRPGFDLLIVPEDVGDWDKTRKLLEKLIALDEKTIDEKLEKAKKRQPFRPVKLKEDMSWEETVKIESFKFEMPGVILEVAPKRSYLYPEALAHLTGYLGEISERGLREQKGGANYSLGDLIGKHALEKAFEEYLRGADGGKEIEVDALGRRIKVVNSTPPYPGNIVRLTIDLKTQLAAWEALRDKVGAAVAIEPKTGKVRAIVSSPSFDPNALSGGVSRQEWNELVNNPLDILTNRATQGQYAPASTFKPIAAVAAIEEKVIGPSTLVYSGPSFSFAGRDYRDWKEAGHGNINVHDAIVESSDTFFYQVGLQLGVESLANYSRQFGFGERTGIGILNEKSGLVPTNEWKKRAYGERWYEGETISVSVGQGYMLATPLQLAVAYSAIANGGARYTPLLIEDITTHDGQEVKKVFPERRGSLTIAPATINIIREALKGVVHEEGGTATQLKTTGLDIAGKTGTAQVARMAERIKDIEEIEYKYRDHAWFAGFAPYDDPALVVVVIVEHGGFGSRAAAPIAAEIFKAYFTTEAEPVTDETGSLKIQKVSAGQGG